MKITEVKIGHETFSDGSLGLTCRVVTDLPQDNEFGTGVAWTEAKTPDYVAGALRQFADAIEKMELSKNSYADVIYVQ